MSHEIEAKIKVSALEPIASKLKALGAKFMHTVHQVDSYFMDSHSVLHKNDCGLRIRRQTFENVETAMITFKSARQGGKYKTRTEFETGIDDADMMDNILEALRYHKSLVVDKNRIMWQLDGCEICLDELTELGFFIEVEGPDEEMISRVLTKLNLHTEPHISDSYASMIRQLQK